ncbi:MAG: hypothetical protein NC489_23350 [Ruminococcus flavefaciens]|nr:hypothetical protein [Ruminococcus flavefaciens]
MKKKLCMLLFGLCLASMSACGNNVQNAGSNNIVPSENSDNLQEDNLNEQVIQKDDTKENVIDITSSENGLKIVPGTYEIGDYIANTNYLITCEETNYSMKVVVFENKEDYNNYQNSDRVTNGEELAAIEKNALYDYYLEIGETGYLGLDDGYVLLIDSGNGKLEELSKAEENNIDLYCGAYFVGNDIDVSSYLVSCTETEYSMQVIVFENKEAYKDYRQTSRFTNGEELAAIEQNALYDCYLEEGKTGYLNLEDGYVLLIDDGNGELNEIDINDTDNGVSWYSDENIGLCRGLYFVDNDIEAGQYSLTCTDSHMQVTVFESIDTYKAYHQISRFTNGEESDAIKQNSILSEYVYEGDSIAVGLHKENILLVSDGTGNMEMLGK